MKLKMERKVQNIVKRQDNAIKQEIVTSTWKRSAYERDKCAVISGGQSQSMDLS